MLINDFIGIAEHKYGITSPKFRLDYSRFLVANSWFHISVNKEANGICISDRDAQTLLKKSDTFLATYNLTSDQKIEELVRRFEESMLETANLLQRFFEQCSDSVSDQSRFYLYDYLLSFLPGEIRLCTDREILDLLEKAETSLTVKNTRLLCDFITWVRLKTKSTAYHNEYTIAGRDQSEQHTAYEPEIYLQLMYKLLNADYINQHDMYRQAAQSRRYANAWLYISLHFVSALRSTDLIRIVHPILTTTPQKTLDRISNGEFDDVSARKILASVIYRMNALQLTPNKTSKYHNVASIKIHIPTSLEVHYGTLLAAAEAHAQLDENYSPDDALIRPIREYTDIKRAMGDDIAGLFKTRNFLSKAANKAYMQTISDLADDILGIENEFHIKGYMLAALARSHKNAYGDFARSTATYLKDAKMAGYSPDFVARELLERGSMSFLTDMLLKMIQPGYAALDTKAQTQAINLLGISPYEIDVLVSASDDIYKRSIQICQELYSTSDTEAIAEILHRIANGNAAGKSEECSCLLRAINGECSFPGQGCMGCDFEISTKSTMYLLIDEVKRLRNLYRQTDNRVLKQKYEFLLKKTIIPRIDEILTCVSEQYGENAAVDLIKIVEGAKQK